MNQTSIWTAQATFGHDIKQTNAKALKFSGLPFDKEKLNAPVFISAIKLVLFLWARVCGSTWRSKTALHNRMKSSASSPPLQSSNNTANERPLRFHIPAKEMHKQRHIKRRKSLPRLQGIRARLSWRCHSRANSHVFRKSRLERHRAKINIADDPFIQLRNEWSAQLTLIHHSPLAIKTRASTGGLVLHRIEWTTNCKPAR